ncbi:uncharacterized protein SCHCODRAFT_02516539 [Schizophyllum commune H4-8]|uniref:uncharacterized protein n=1 Tax=Schizophyllum commune (strain H4-8 / FGSC 9210) TaxID=578458 RepID=UPI00215E3537|nr:uncharacterized protein SCHCODRAFT_02516539 [Schizophyllum commune H4-8]KAI5886736.1 hypothetical protein SCHCODRAFT_02516539 [Schizophyllum commune H4-8]
MIISHTVDFNGVTMVLRGIVYAGENHFTCRVVDSSGTLFKHDGMVNGDVCEKEAELARVNPEELGTWRTRGGEIKPAVLVIYERSQQTSGEVG